MNKEEFYIWTNQKRLFTQRERSRFTWQTEWLKREFERAFNHNGPRVTLFLAEAAKVHSDPYILADMISQLRGPRHRQAFRKYLEYSKYFGVSFTMHRRYPHFTISFRSPARDRLDAEVVDGRLMSAKPTSEEPEEVPSAAEEFIGSSVANFIRITDQSGTSALHDLENLAFTPNRLTLVLHETATVNYLMCVIGDRVTATDLRKSISAISKLQKELFARYKTIERRNARKNWQDRNPNPSEE